jgi:hypothetical protein
MTYETRQIRALHSRMDHIFQLLMMSRAGGITVASRWFQEDSYNWPWAQEITQAWQRVHAILQST